jgi:hypothetical protein
METNKEEGLEMNVSEPTVAYAVDTKPIIRKRVAKSQVKKEALPKTELEELKMFLKDSKKNLENLEATRRVLENLEFKLLVEPLVIQVEADILALEGHYTNLVKEVHDRTIEIGLDVKDTPTSSIFYAVRKKYYRSFYDLDWSLDFSINITYEENE